MEIKPNIPITIPQLFYDIIARILPGFLFLVTLYFELSIEDLDLFILTSINNSNSILYIGQGILILILSYIIGIMLNVNTKSFPQKSILLLYFDKKVKKYYSRDNNDKILNYILKKDKSIIKNRKGINRRIKFQQKLLNKMFLTIREKNGEAAFRLVKLRAEYKMAMGIRNGMTICFILSIIILLFFDKAREIPEAIFRVTIPFITLIIFFIFEFRFRNYRNGNIEKHYYHITNCKNNTIQKELEKLAYSEHKKNTDQTELQNWETAELNFLDYYQYPELKKYLF